MAIYHCSMKPVSRSGGRSAVAAIAYRTASRMVNERDGLVHDFTAKAGVVHAEIVLPGGSEARWALDRSALWNAVEFAERRRDARLAREFEVALPHELNVDQRLALVRAFARDLADRHGAAVDFAIHAPGGDSDIRNSHAHVMMTTRTVGPDGLGEKTLIERENKWLLNHDLPTAQMQLREIRQAWETHANRALMLAGHEERIDHRSHLERGLEIEPTEHMGVHASEIDRRGGSVSRTRIDEEAARRNAELIREKPEQVLTLITGEKSVFDRYDVARALHRYIDDASQFRNAFAAVMGSKALVELRTETAGELARYTTREMLEIEHAMAASADRMSRHSGQHSSRNGGHGVDRRHVDQALVLQDEAIRTRTLSVTPKNGTHATPSDPSKVGELAPVGLSDEQRLAVRHVTGPEQIAAVIGFAGAGKSTMLAAARQAWERQGYRVHGAALAGKAAEGLEESSGIVSRTLASWEHSWQAGRAELQSGDILVIDEAVMISSRQLGRFVEEVERRGAKLVLVGDHEQLQAIGAGSPFRAIAERIGAVELSEIRRQKEDWQRQASIAFATHRTGEGLSAYAERGQVHFADDREGAREALVRDYLADRDARPGGSRVALAHRRVAVRAINDAIRRELQARGVLAKAAAEELGQAGQGSLQGDVRDRDRADHEIIYQTNDGRRGFAPGDRIVLLENNRDLGVKNGMLGTVTAVELDALQVRLDGAGQNAARVISIQVRSFQSFDHGYATTVHKAQGATVDRAFVMASTTMDRHLAYVAMTRHRDAVRLYAGRDELKDMKALSASLGRSGAKETVLDYTDVFAARRGLGEGISLRSEIVLSPTPERDGAHRASDRPAAHYGALGERVRSPADRQPFDEIARVDISRTGRTERGAGADKQSVKVPPLVPAATRYARTVGQVARAEASRHMDQALDAVCSVGAGVFAHPENFASLVARTICERDGDVAELMKAVARRPEVFGKLLGKAGLLGENRERKEARRLADALSAHVGHAARHCRRRYEHAARSEEWKREKQDVIEVPGLSGGSEAVLKQLDRLGRSEKPAFLDRLVETPEGRLALQEAEAITDAMRRRFGTSDLRNKDLMEMTRGQVKTVDLSRLAEVVQIAFRAKTTEILRQEDMLLQARKRPGLDMRM